MIFTKIHSVNWHVQKSASKVLPVENESSNRFSLKPKKEIKKKEFYVSDEYGNFFCGYKDAYPYYSNKIVEARELTEDIQFDTLVRWEKGIRKLKKEYL